MGTIYDEGFWSGLNMWKIKHLIFMKDKNLVHKGSKKKIEQNIYHCKTLGEFSDRMHFVHHVLKYKFIVPIFWLIEKFISKKLIKKVPKGEHNINIKIFNKAYDNALQRWTYSYFRNAQTTKENLKKSGWKKWQKESFSFRYRKMIKELILTEVLTDTADREFLNILMYEIGIQMVNEYSGKTVNHIFWSTDQIYDVNYFTLFKRVRQEVTPLLKKADFEVI